ncbi:MAG: MerR family transcriptional regulator [Pararhodobacter sp.]
MKKAPDAFRTISEVSEILDTPAHVLRFWESKFYQIKPVKRAGGRRYYRPDDVALINGIRILLQDQGMTIRGVQRVLHEQGVKHVASLGGPLPLDVEDAVEDSAAETSAATVPLARDDGRAAVADAEIVDEPAAPATDDPARADSVTQGPIVAQEPAQDPEHEPVPDAAPHGATAVSAPDSVPEPTLPPITANTEVPAEAPRAEPDRIARSLRNMPRGQLGKRRDSLELLALRIDALLERMSEASGAGRW